MKQLLSLIILIGLISSCAPSEEQLISDIDKVNAEMKSADNIDQDKVAQVISLYDDYIVRFPESTNTPGYLEMQAKYYSVHSEYDKAYANYEKIYTDYQDYNKRPSALFMMAFIAEVNMENLDQAESLYKQFLDEFPEDEFADDAEFSLRNMHMSPEELLEFFKQQSAVDTSAAL